MRAHRRSGGKRLPHGGPVDSALVERALVKSFLEMATRAARRQGVPTADRDDVAQEAVIEALRKRDTYEERGSRAAWIAGFVRIAALEHYARQRRSARPVAAALEELATTATVDPEDVVARRDLSRRVLAGMLKRDREALVLHAVEGLTLRDVAREQGRSKTNVFKGLRSATAALRERGRGW